MKPYWLLLSVLTFALYRPIRGEEIAIPPTAPEPDLPQEVDPVIANSPTGAAAAPDKKDLEELLGSDKPSEAPIEEVKPEPTGLKDEKKEAKKEEIPSSIPSPEPKPTEDLAKETKDEIPPPPTEPVTTEPVSEKSEPIASERSSENRSERAEKARIPIYQRVLPRWAVQANYSPNAFGDTSGFKKNSHVKFRGVLFEFDYQPESIQKFGVLGFGPHIAVYPTTPLKASNTRVANWGIGAQIKYQARFFREQPLVPFAGLSYEYLRYNLTRGGASDISPTGFHLGGMLLLNFIDRASAAEFYANHGISRSYFVAELRMLSGGDTVINPSGSALFFGLRIEY